MSSCCQTLAEPTRGTAKLTVALAGNPNSGKTTLFNALTGLRQKVANYPGVTVEKKTGRCKLPDGSVADIIDLPGTYSLISRSPDEHVAMEVLRGLRADTPRPDVVIVVVDASNLQRNLYLVSQLIELGRPLVVALNMIDIAERRGLRVSAETLQRELGVPVIPVVGYKRKGIAELKAAIQKATVAPMPDWPLPHAMKEEVLLVGGGLAILDSPEQLPGLASARFSATARLDGYRAMAERLLIGDRADDLKHVAAREPVSSLLNSASSRLQTLGIDPMQADVEAHYQWIEGVAQRVSSAGQQPTEAPILSYEPRRTLTQRVDAILIHKVWGLLVFALIMGALFVTLFWLAQPIMDAIQNGIKALGVWTTTHLSDGPLKDLLNDGIFAGVGTVVVFVPQIALLFFFLAILEDSGYLARAAFLMDRLLAKTGLHGKSFIPLLSSFACAIPGIMATRTIENRRERLATILVAPFMSCSARLPVYTLLIGAFFASYGAVRQAGIMLACYALGIVAAAGTAWLFKRTLTGGPATSFILELPTYKIPQASQVARQVWMNTRAFLTKAGTTIFCLSVILWAMAYYPRLPQDRKNLITSDSARSRAKLDVFLGHFVPASGATTVNGTLQIKHLEMKSGNVEGTMVINGKMVSTQQIEQESKELVDRQVAAAQAEYSLSGRLGHFMEPALRPLGYDWKMGIGLVSAFAAREVFISSMGIVYSVGNVEDGKTADLASAMKADMYSSGPRAGKPVWTPIVAVSLLVWFVLAMQCMSTFAVVRRETGGWRWPIFMLVYMNALAYVVALLVYQVGTRVFV
ncbi:MAG TPA: ferrous iron transport protein B [Tepidisphaeraceae bacterium]|nr:ferrous iron transport protein B [Tepidisphaeraceae bacterium]